MRIGRRALIAAVALEVLGIALTGGSIGVEIATRAELGYVLITGGSCLIAAGGVIFAKFMKRGQK